MNPKYAPGRGRIHRGRGRKGVNGWRHLPLHLIVTDDGGGEGGSDDVGYRIDGFLAPLIRQAQIDEQGTPLHRSRRVGGHDLMMRRKCPFKCPSHTTRVLLMFFFKLSVEIESSRHIRRCFCLDALVLIHVKIFHFSSYDSREGRTECQTRHAERHQRGLPWRCPN